MLSPGRRSPLNFNTATVSSSTSLFLSPSSFSSSPSATLKLKQKSSLVYSSSTISSSLLSSIQSLFLVAVLSYLMCHSLVFSSPISSYNNITAKKYSLHSGKHHTKDNLTNSNITNSWEDMPQNDAYPRSMYPSYTVPDSWKRQSQMRFYYLRAENDQFLQLNGYTVTGTNVEKPALGMVRFLSHEQNIVIVGFHEKKYLCMNATFALYLSDQLNSDCYIQESSLLDSGSHTTTYDFIKYKKNKKLYLGINCDPMLGSETDLSMKETRFSRLDISEDDAEAVRKEIERSGPEKHVEEKCERVHERKKAARIRRRNLRYKWCWNIDRMIAHRGMYMQKCRDQEKDKCDKKYPNTDSEECVCDILSRMLAKPKRAKRKCLIEKLTKWVENQNMTSNSKAIVEVSKLLLSSYSGIARRMRLLKSKQNKQHELESKTQLNKNIRQHVSPEHQRQPTLQTSTQSPQSRRKDSGCNDGSSQNIVRKCRRPIIKLNYILEKYRKELILPSGRTSFHGPSSVISPRTFVNKDINSDTTKQKVISVLSREFINDLTSLTKTHTRKQRTNHRKKKVRKARRLKNAETPFDMAMSTDNRNSRIFRSVSPD